MHLHAALNNAQPGGKMTGSLRFAMEAIFSGIDVKLATVTLTKTPGLGITVIQKNLIELAAGDS